MIQSTTIILLIVRLRLPNWGQFGNRPELETLFSHPCRRLYSASEGLCSRSLLIPSADFMFVLLVVSLTSSSPACVSVDCFTRRAGLKVSDLNILKKMKTGMYFNAQSILITLLF